LKLFSTELKNPLILASGILGVTLASLRRVHTEGAGAVTTKSITISKRKGHKAPIFYSYSGSALNSVGLSNPGVDDFIRQISRERMDFPLIVSIFGNTIDEFIMLVEKLNPFDFLCFELNLSCPNVEDEFGKPVSYSPERTGIIVRETRGVSKKPIIAKLSPDAPSLVAVACAAEKSGADAICISNTLGQGMIIDVSTGTPVLSAKAGGLSGKSIFPLTVKNVYDVYSEVNVPIIGTGGVTDANDAIQLIMAGASFIGLGTAIYTEGISVFKKIDEEIRNFMQINKIDSIDELIGYSHRKNKKYFINPFSSSGHSIAVSEIIDIYEDTRSIVRNIYLRYRGNGEPKPGQFYMIWIPGVDQKPFSVSFFDGSVIGFSVKKRGEFSRKIFLLKKGDFIGLTGPLGSGFSCGISGKRFLLVGGGIGIAPLVFAAKKLAEMDREVLLFMGASGRSELSWTFEMLERSGLNDKIYIETCTEDGSHGLKGLLTDHLEQLLKKYQPDFSFLCGPEIFIEKSISILTGLGLKGEASVERMMKCGVGICGSCCIDDTGERVCVEGPVFPIDHLASLEEFGRYRRDESGSIVPIS